MEGCVGFLQVREKMKSKSIRCMVVKCKICLEEEKIALYEYNKGYLWKGHWNVDKV